MATNLSPDVRRGAFFNSLGGLFRFGLNLLAIPVLINGLGLERYGIWSVLLAVVNITLTLRPGWNEGLTHFLAGARAVQDTAASGRYLGTSLGLTFIWGALLAGVLALASGPLAEALFHDLGASNIETLQGLLVLLAVALWARLLQQWAVAAQAGLMRFDVSAGLESALGALLTLGWMLLADAGFDLPAMAAWTVGMALLSAAVHLVMALRSAGLRPAQLRAGGQAARELSSYGVLSATSNIGSIIFSQADRILVSAVLGPVETGLYAAAAAVAAKINEVIALPLQALPPAVSNAMATTGRERVAFLFGRAFHLNAFLVWVLATGLTLFARPIGRVLVGSDHELVFASTLVILALCYSLYCLNGPAYYVTLGTNQLGISAAATVLGGGLTLLLMYWWLPVWGVLGAALGNLGFQTTWLITWGVARLHGHHRPELWRDIIVALSGLTIIAAIGIATVAIPAWYPFSLVLAIIASGVLAFSWYLADLKYIMSLVFGAWQQLLQMISPKTLP